MQTRLLIEETREYQHEFVIEGEITEEQESEIEEALFDANIHEVERILEKLGFEILEEVRDGSPNGGLSLEGVDVEEGQDIEKISDS